MTEHFHAIPDRRHLTLAKREEWEGPPAGRPFAGWKFVARSYWLITVRPSTFGEMVFAEVM